MGERVLGPDGSGNFSQVCRALSHLANLRLVCVDLFDTVITRGVTEPSAVYLLLGHSAHARRLIEAPPETFARARMGAEARARSHVRGDGDITLAGIYRELCHVHPQWQAVQKALMELELETERGLIRPVPGAAAFLRHARAKVGPIAFVSDMYLPRDFLHERLLEHDLFRDGDELFVSSACNCMKARNGALFRHVLTARSCNAAAAVHVGNHLEDDYAQARKVGMHAILAPWANPTRFEELLEEHRWSSGAGTSLLAGASRMARLSRPWANRHERALIEVAAGVGAPLLLSFSLWLLRCASRRGIRRLYHLSREGQILHRLASVLCRRLGLPIENRYLYVSRRSLNLCLLDNFDRNDLTWTLTHAEEQDLTRILERVGLVPQDVADVLARMNIPRARWRAYLSDAERAELLERLLEEPCRSLVRARSQKSRALAEAYLQQEGVFDDVDCGLVDSGGLGSQMRTLNVLRGTRGLSPVTGFAFYRDHDPRLPLEGFPPLHAFLYDSAQGLGEARVKGMWEMLETFCSADHGMVTGYEREGDRIVPRIEPGRAAQMSSWGLPLVQDTMEACAEALSCTDERHARALERDAREGLSNVMKLFWESPYAYEAAAWGSFHWEGDGGDAKGGRPLAGPLRTLEALSLLKHNAAHDRVWPAGSEKRSPPHVRAVLMLGRAMPKPIRQLIRRGLTSSPASDVDKG